MAVEPIPCGPDGGGGPVEVITCCSPSIAASALCRADGTAVLLVVRSGCVECGATPDNPTVVGWIDPATGVFTAGAAPADAGSCEAGCATVTTVQLCDLTDSGCVPFLRHLVRDCAGAVTGHVDTTLDGVSTYLVSGTAGDCSACSAGCVDTVCVQRCDDTDGDGVADATYSELWCVHADGSTALILVYQADPSVPYTPVSPVECTYGCPTTETVMLCDDSGPFLRRYTFLNGAASYEDVALDGQTPHIVNGTVRVCATSTECEEPTTPTATVGLCLADGTPIAVVVTRDCDGTVRQDGWLNLTTGAYSAGDPPAGTMACGNPRNITTAGVFCDVAPVTGDVLGLVLVEYTYGPDGDVASVRLVDATSGATYVPQGEVTTCPAGVEQPERDLLQMCDTAGDGGVTVFVRDYARDENGQITGHSDYLLDGTPYTPTGEVGLCQPDAEPCRDTTTVLLCDTAEQEALTVFDPINRPGDDGWEIVAFTGQPGFGPEQPLPYPAVHPPGNPAYMGARSDMSAGPNVGPWAGYESAPLRWVMRKTFLAPQDGVATVSSVGFRGDGGARVRVNNTDAGMYGQWNQPATSGTAQIPVTAGPNTIEIEVRDIGGANWITGRLDIAMVQTRQFMRTVTVDCESGEVVATTDTTLDGEPYTPTGEVGLCEPVAECCPAPPPETRLDVETVLLCIQDAGGGITGQVLAERVYDDQTGELTVQRLIDLSTGEEADLPDGGELVACRSETGGADVETWPLCVLNTDGSVLQHIRAEQVYDGDGNPAGPPRLVDAVTGGPVAVPGGATIGVCPEPCRDTSTLLVCDLPGDGGPAPTVTDNDPAGVFPGTGQEPVAGGAAALWSGGSLIIPPDDAPPGDGTSQLVRTFAASVQADRPACDAGTATVTASIRVERTGPDDGCQGTGSFRMLVGGTQIAAAGVTPSSIPVGTVQTLTVTGQVPAADLAAGTVRLFGLMETYQLALAACPGSGPGGARVGGWVLDEATVTVAYDQDGCAQQVLATVVTDCQSGEVTSVTYTTSDGQPYNPVGQIGACTTAGGQCCPAEPCRNSTTVLLCDIPTDGAAGEPTVTDLPAPPGGMFPPIGGTGTYRALAGGGAALWSGGSLAFPAEPGTGNIEQTYRTVEASVQADRPACDDGTATVTVSVHVTQLGPDAGVGYSGALRLFDAGRQMLGNRSVPTDVPAGWDGVLTVTASVPAVQLAAGQIGVHLDLETGHGVTRKSWTADAFNISYAYDVAGCATQILRTLTVDCATGEVVQVSDTTLDGAPYEVTGQVGQCQAAGGGECCPPPPPEHRVDVEPDVMCIQDADGELLGQVLVERVYDDQTGERVVQRLADPTTGEEVELPDGAGLVLCQEPPCPTAFATECVGAVSRTDASYDNTSLIGGVPGQCGSVQGPADPPNAGANFGCAGGPYTITSWVVNGVEVIAEGGGMTFQGGPCGPGTAGNPGMHLNWAQALTNLDPTGATWVVDNAPGCAWFVRSEGGSGNVYGPMTVTGNGVGVVDGTWVLGAAQSCEETQYTKVYTQECDGSVSVSWLDAQGAEVAPPAGELVPCGTGCGSGGGRGLDVETLTLCDVAPDGSSVPFLRHITYGTGGQVVTVADTALDAFSPYTPTGVVGRCAEQRRLDVEATLVCVRDQASGDILGQVLVERVYDDQSGVLLEQRLTTLDGEPYTLPAGAELTKCPSPDRITRQVCVVESGSAEFMTNAANATSGQDTDWVWAPTIEGAWYPMYRVAPNPVWTVTDAAPPGNRAHWVSPHQSRSVCSPNPGASPNVTSTWFTRASWNLPADADPDSIRISATIMNGDNGAVQWRLNDGPWQPIANGALGGSPWTFPPTAVPGGRPGQNEIIIQQWEQQPGVSCPSLNEGGMIMHVYATYDHAPKVWTQVIEPGGQVYYLDETGARQDSIPDGRRLVPCGAGGDAPCCPTVTSEPLTLCDIAGDGTATTFLRHFTYTEGYDTPDVRDTLLDGVTAYTPTGDVGTCPGAGTVVPEGRDVELVPLCVIDNNSGGVLQQILAEIRYDTETGERIGVNFVDRVTGAPVPVPGGAHLGVCPGSEPGPDVEVLPLCDDDGAGGVTPFLRHLVYTPGSTTPAVVDTLLDGVTPYVVTGSAGACDCAKHLLRECRWDDTTGDGIGDTAYVELIEVDGCTGTLTPIGAYLPDLSGPYEPVAPASECPVEGAPPARGVQARRVELTTGQSWDSAAVPLLQSVTVTAHGGDGQITTSDGVSTLFPGESVTWSVARGGDAALTGPLIIAAGTGTVTVAFTQGVVL